MDFNLLPTFSFTWSISVDAFAIFINDKFSDGKLCPLEIDLLSTTIGDNVLIGSNATILPVDICSNVTIGAGAVVTKDITQPGTYVGNPARRVNDPGPYQRYDR